MMTRLKQVFVTLLLLTKSFVCAYSQNTQTLFDHANDAYKQGDFAGAYKLYGDINQKTNNIHFNMGNCAFKLGKNGYALLHWRRAEQNWGVFGREELNNNLRMLKEHIKGRNAKEENIVTILSGLYQSTKSLFFSLIRATPLFNLQILVLISWMILFVALRYLFRRRLKAITIVLFTIFACSAAMLAIKYNFNHRTIGITIVEKTEIFSGPGDNFSLLGLLPEASEVAILKASGAFYKIRHTQQIGWINKKQIEVL